MSHEAIKNEAAAVASALSTDPIVSKNPIDERGPPEVPKKVLGKLSCFARGSNIECLVSHDDILPKKPARRVRDLGREIVDRANRCTWYENMVEDELNAIEKKEAKEKTDEEQTEAAEGKEANEKTSSVDLSGDENENKMLLKRLEKQQKALLKQQHALNKQLGLEVGPGELGICDSKSELMDDYDKMRSPRRIGSHQRRLRGDVARHCAERSEGSIKSLIWNDDFQANDITAKPSQTDAKSIWSSISMEPASRNIERTTSCAGKINSSSAISALISNSFCNSLQ